MANQVQNFSYNGFSGEILEGYADYTAQFKEWTTDPGVAVFICSDGKERLIPTFAIRGERGSWPKQQKTGELFGRPCES